MRSILLDLDGTVIDTNHLIVTTFQHTFRTCLGLEVPAADITPWFGEPLRVSMARLAPPDRVEELVRAYRTYNQTHHDELARPVPGMAEALAALQAAGVKLGVTTSKMTHMALRGLRLFGLECFFGAVVGWDGSARQKPDPEPLLATLERLGEAPGPDVLMVGDSPHDLEAGRRAGLRTVAVRWSLLPHARLAAAWPDHWIDAPADLVALALG